MNLPTAILSILVITGFVWLLNRITPYKVCPICAGVSGTWLFMLGARFLGYSVDPAILAMLLGTLGKIIGVRGIFWQIAGNRVSEIDGFNPDAMDPYKEHAALPPKEPEKVCEEIEGKLGIPAIIIDGNNINVEVIAMSKSVPVDKKTARMILLDNPMGQDDEMTPFILVRRG